MLHKVHSRLMLAASRRGLCTQRRPTKKSRQKLRERQVPTGQVERAVSFAQLGLGLAMGAAGEVASRAIGGSSTGSLVLNTANAARLADSLRRMRGAALKLGQMLSVSDDSLLPEEVRSALATVRDGADAMTAEQLEQTLRTSLGNDWRDQLLEFEDEPFAAASIGQVHRAVGQDGSQMVLKVQFPGVAESINSDLKSLEQLATWVLPSGLYASNIVRVASLELAEECDYTLEASYQKQFYKLANGWEGFRVPKTFDALSTKQVLASEHMTGSALGVLRHEPDQGIRNSVARRLLRLTLKELFEWRLMQTDPNWSNYLYKEETGEIALIDFGAVRVYSKQFCDSYIRLIRACVDKDREKVLEHSVRLGFLTGDENQLMKDAHVASAFAIGRPFSHEGEYDFRAQHVTEEVKTDAQVMLKHRLTPPPDEAYSLHRKLAGMFMLCIELNAVIDCRAIFDEQYSKYQFED